MEKKRSLISPDEIPAFDREFFASDNIMSRIGGGSIGGKASGLAFAHTVLSSRFPNDRYIGLEVSIPRFVVIGTDLFDAFMERNNLHELVDSKPSSQHLSLTFQRASFPAECVGDLRGLITKVNSPLAVRSSSMLEDDMRWIIRRLGPERETLSHSFKSFIDHGVVTVGGSDIPGAQGATFKNHPRAIFNALVNRTRNDGTPEGGWLPEQRITMHDAIKMYTLDAAYSVFDEDVRGSIKVGKLADLTVTDLNLIEIDPTDVLSMNVIMTVVDGRIVFEQGEH